MISAEGVVVNWCGVQPMEVRNCLSLTFHLCTVPFRSSSGLKRSYQVSPRAVVHRLFWKGDVRRLVSTI